jgi:hypothetical protein
MMQRAAEPLAGMPDSFEIAAAKKGRPCLKDCRLA